MEWHQTIAKSARNVAATRRVHVRAQNFHDLFTQPRSNSLAMRRDIFPRKAFDIKMYAVREEWNFCETFLQWAFDVKIVATQQMINITCTKISYKWVAQIISSKRACTQSEAGFKRVRKCPLTSMFRAMATGKTPRFAGIGI